MAQRVPPRSEDLRRQLLSIVDAASSLGISRAGVYRLVGEGALPLVKIGQRSLIDSRDISALIERQKAVR
jgi:excisionase family DNA binding protein